MLSVIIPSRVSTYLQKTIDDLLFKAHGDVEIVVVLDGYLPEPAIVEDPRVVTVYQGSEDNNLGMRAGINSGMAFSTGDYVMKVDEHCMFDEGYDVKLTAVCGPKQLIVPRRHRLDAENWCLIEDERPPIDYMFLSRAHGYLHGWRWDELYEPKKHIPIDEVMTIQGSCWFMHRSLWDELVGPLDDENYGPFANEAQEVSLKVWLGGGQCLVNKATWYAHYHKKGSDNGYRFTREQYRKHKESIKRGRKFCTDFWMNNKWDKQVRNLDWLVRKFKPVPTWHKG